MVTLTRPDAAMVGKLRRAKSDCSPAISKTTEAGSRRAEIYVVINTLDTIFQIPGEVDKVRKIFLFAT